MRVVTSLFVNTEHLLCARLYIYPPLIPKITPRGRHYYYPHLTDEQLRPREVKSTEQRHRVGAPEFESGSWAPGRALKFHAVLHLSEKTP